MSIICASASKMLSIAPDKYYGCFFDDDGDDGSDDGGGIWLYFTGKETDYLTLES